MAATVAVAALSGACAIPVMEFTIASSKEIEWSRAGRFEQIRKSVEGEDIVAFGEPDMNKALDRALEGVPGAVAVVDGKVRLYVAAFYLGYIVEGKALIDRSIAPREDAGAPGATVVHLMDAGSEVFHLTPADFAAFRAMLGERAKPEILAFLLAHDPRPALTAAQ
ncbi:MAG: hypothetical protein KC466_13575 [Myxococcales bacterium]|nr:hypothetical protein [Myxococcales bacterium]